METIETVDISKFPEKNTETFSSGFLNGVFQFDRNLMAFLFRIGDSGAELHRSFGLNSRPS